MEMINAIRNWIWPQPQLNIPINIPAPDPNLALQQQINQAQAINNALNQQPAIQPAIQPQQPPVQPAPQPANQPPAQPAQPDPNAVLQRIILERQLADIRNANRQKCLDYLYMRTFGKKIDSNYLTYCTALLNEYLDTLRIVDYTERRALCEGVIREHVYAVLNADPILSVNVVRRANQYNNEVSGIAQQRSWWCPWVYETYHLETPNVSPPAPTSSPFRTSHLMIGVTVVAATALTYKFLTSNPSVDQATTTIIPIVEKLPLPPTEIDTPQCFCQNTTRILSQIVTAISSGSSVILGFIQSKSM